MRKNWQTKFNFSLICKSRRDFWDIDYVAFGEDHCHADSTKFFDSLFSFFSLSLSLSLSEAINP